MSEKNSHIAEETIQAYLEGKLSAKESNKLERLALTDQYLNDRLAGDEVQKEQGIDMASVKATLQERLRERTKERNKSTIWLKRLSIAAAVLIVGSFSFLLWKTLAPDQDLAVLKETNTETKTPSLEHTENEEEIIENETNSNEAIESSKFYKQEESISNKNYSIATKEQIIIMLQPKPIVESESFDQVVAQKSSQSIERSNSEIPSPPVAARAEAAPIAKAKALTQSIVKGKVVDEFGDPLPGVQISNESLGITKTSDIEGNFEIPSSLSSDKLRMNYIGFESKTVSAGFASNQEIELTVDSQTLSELVITKPIKDQAAQPKEGWKVLNEARRINGEIQGKVNVSFDISPSGDIENIKIIKSLNAQSDAEVLGVLNKFSHWKPEIADGKPVKTSRKLSFKFLKKKE